MREFKGVDVHTSHIFDVKFDVGRIVRWVFFGFFFFLFHRADDFLFSFFTISTSHDQKIVVHDFSVGLNTSLFV